MEIGSGSSSPTSSLIGILAAPEDVSRPDRDPDAQRCMNLPTIHDGRAARERV